MKKEIQVGQKIDMLTVLKKYTTIVKNKEVPMCECECECGTIIKKRESWLKKENAALHSCGCKSIANPKYGGKKLSVEEAIEWDKLYAYVKTNVMDYHEEQSLPTFIVQRLKGLAKGKFIENRAIPDNANYDYNTILLAFKYCYFDIKKGINGKKFTSEQAKFNYIMKIVEGRINYIYQKVKQAKIEEEKINQIDWDYYANYQNNFKPKDSPKRNSHKYDDLW